MICIHWRKKDPFRATYDKVELQSCVSAVSERSQPWLLPLYYPLNPPGMERRWRSLWTHPHDWQPHSASRSHPLGISSWRSCGEWKPFLWTFLKQEKVAGSRQMIRKIKGFVAKGKRWQAGRWLPQPCFTTAAATLFCELECAMTCMKGIFLPLWIL